MEIRGIKVNAKSVSIFILHTLIFADIVLITAGFLLDLPSDASFAILIFDLFICILLLGEWTIKFLKSESKREFLKEKENIVTFLASIPYEVLFPAMLPGANLIRYIMLFKLLRIIVLYKKFFTGFDKFIRKTNLDKIFGGVFFTVAIFTVLYTLFGSPNDLFESFYFVIVTLTTVGYGDIVPQTFNEKILAILLIIAGIFIVAIITAAISSYLTDRLLDSGDEDIKGTINDNSQAILDELKAVREENRKLKDEIDEIKEMIKEK